jgi:excisionase family DNA binding protein
MANHPSPKYLVHMGSTIPAHVEDFAERFGRDERLYSAQEVAERLGVSERWVRDHATRRNPRIQAVKLGPLLRFRWQDVQEFLARQMTHTTGRNRGNL